MSAQLLATIADWKTTFGDKIESLADLHILEMDRLKPHLVGPFTGVYPDRPGVYITQDNPEFSPAKYGLYRRFDGEKWCWGESVAEFAARRTIMAPNPFNYRYWWGLTEEAYNILKEHL